MATGLAALMGSVLISGCSGGPESQTPEAPPFVFRSLELRQKKANGQRDWDLTSPEARYEFNRRLVKARRPEGILYRDNKPAFEIRAERATVMNDGELVLLEGNVELQQLQGQKVLIQGDRLRWTPPKSLLVMEQRPVALDGRSKIRALRARFDQISEDLTMEGTVQLERWSTVKKQRSGAHADTVLRAHHTVWNLGNGALNARGPVLGQRRNDQHLVLQQLHAKQLTGNTLQGFIDLIAPVKVLSPKRKGHLNAATTRWNLKDDSLVTEKTFSGQLDQAKLRGDGFRIDLTQNKVQVLSACDLQQPGESLKAHQCSWNWNTNEVSAEGDVVLKRKANEQITRSQRLEGSVGKKGTVVFSSPGGAVQSELKVKGTQPGGSTATRRRSSPVSF